MKILVTAGPTREPIDPVRFISNRSSGKMGYALTRSALARGHAVRLISGPVSLQAPEKARVFNVMTATDMLAAVAGNMEWCDALIMAAAVCDWRPSVVSGEKIKKEFLKEIALTPNPDLLGELKELKKANQVIVGFAAETQDLDSNAAAKLATKGLDLIYVNDVSDGAIFGSDLTSGTVMDKNGPLVSVTDVPKDTLANVLLDQLLLQIG